MTRAVITSLSSEESLFLLGDNFPNQDRTVLLAHRDDVSGEVREGREVHKGHPYRLSQVNRTFDSSPS
jgi:hypothetical protein